MQSNMRKGRGGTRRMNAWPGLSIIVLALVSASVVHCTENGAPTGVEKEAAAPVAATAGAAPAKVDATSSDRPARLSIDLSRIDRKSAAYARFREWVDAAVAGRPGYAFSASDAALMFRLAGTGKYCDLAVKMVESEVLEAEGLIASGGRPAIAGDSYLEVGPRIADLSTTLDACADVITEAQRARWSAYAEQAVWNVWNHSSAKWGAAQHPWTGWSTDNPGNNYYYSFVEATMFWALASGSRKWMDELSTRRLPPLQSYFARLKGGGSSEGTGYGASHMRLFSLYRIWRDSTGEDLAGASTHARDSIPYWVHATVPTLDRFAPIGDQSRNSVPELYDYHRRVVLEARQLTQDPEALATSSWWLENISVPQMSGGFNARYDLLPAGEGGRAPSALSHYASGTGHLFSRTSWDKDAMWVAFVAGPYNESHAHQDQGAFTLFAGDWLAVTENIWTHSGIQQGTGVHNVVRFERSDASGRQCASPADDHVVHQCENPESRAVVKVDARADGSFTANADLTPVYGGNPALSSWTRQLQFQSRLLTVVDRFKISAGTRAIFQVNVPVEPQINGNEVTAGRLRMKVLEPATPAISAYEWSTGDSAEFRRGWRIDVTGGLDGYVVELGERDKRVKP